MYSSIDPGTCFIMERRGIIWFYIYVICSLVIFSAWIIEISVFSEVANYSNINFIKEEFCWWQFW